MDEKQSETSQSNGFNIEMAARLGSGFQFGKSISLEPDLANSEFRFLMLGWLDHAHGLLSRNGSLQEFRDTIERLVLLTNRVSAHQLKLIEERKQRDNAIRERAAMKDQEQTPEGTQ